MNASEGTKTDALLPGPLRSIENEPVLVLCCTCRGCASLLALCRHCSGTGFQIEVQALSGKARNLSKLLPWRLTNVACACNMLWRHTGPTRVRECSFTERRLGLFTHRPPFARLVCLRARGFDRQNATLEHERHAGTQQQEMRWPQSRYVIKRVGYSIV